MPTIINPYSDINWSNQQKGNFHTHTKETTINGLSYGSDGVLTQQETIDAYYNAGYNILAITDHNMHPRTTYPWTLFDRNPSTLGMLAIEGNELSNGDHIGSLFNNLGTSGSDEAVTIAAIEANGGLSIINHPGRYEEAIAWLANLLITYADSCIGLEVHNQGDRYINDRRVWDAVNKITIPLGKVTYGFSNDDMHSTAHLFKSYQFILSELTEASVKTAMAAGKTYFCYEPLGSGDAKAPRITSIVVDNITKTITITADSGIVTWITEGTKQVATGNVFDYNAFNKLFVRAEITNSYGITYTQPFAFTYTGEHKNIIDTFVKKGETAWEKVLTKYDKVSATTWTKLSANKIKV